MCGFIAQLVEHRTGIAEVMGSNPVEALIFFRLLLSNCLNWKIYCDDHTSLSSLLLPLWDVKTKRPQTVKGDWPLFLCPSAGITTSLLSSMADFVPCDRLLQKAISVVSPSAAVNSFIL